MFYLIKDNVVVQKQPNKPDDMTSWIETDVNATCGMILTGDDQFENPFVVITEDQIIDLIWNHHVKLLKQGIIFDGHRHGGTFGHREYISSQYNLITSGETTQYGNSLRDSDGNDQPMTDAKMRMLYLNGVDYVSKINQVAMAAEDLIKLMSHDELNTYDIENDIAWPSNVYSYSE